MAEWAADYAAIRSVAQFEERVNTLIQEGLPFGFDIESSYVGDYIEDKQLLTYHPEWKLVGFSFTNALTWARYVPIDHLTGENIDDRTQAARLLWRLLNTGLAVAHNAPFELNGTARWFRDMLWDDPLVGEQVRASNGFFPMLADTMTMCHMVAVYPPNNVVLRNGSGRVGLGLKSLVKHIFHHDQVEFDSLFTTPSGKKAPQKDKKFDLLPVNQKHVSYACEDAIFTLAIYERHLPDLADDFLWKVEMKLMPVLCRMEAEGIYLDWNTIEEKANEVAQFKDRMEEEILLDFSDRLGRPVAVNLGSPLQLQKILFDPAPDGLGLTPKDYTEKGAPSTDEKALRLAAKSDRTIKRLLEFREVAKLYGSYLNKYRTQLHYDTVTDRAHPNHKQVGALTGRMAVDRVSYQQWPKPYHYELADGTTFDMNFRDLLIAPPGARVVGFDYSQVELRVLAGLAEEKAMLRAFNTGVDIHKATAAAMMKIPVEEVTKKQRAVGKTLNFAVVYGSGAANIAEMLTTPDAPVTTEDAEGYLRDYFSGFPNLRSWMNKQVAEGNESFDVYTPFGRRYHLWELESPNAFIRSKAKRMAVNAPVQGGAADYMKVAMVRVAATIEKAEAKGLIPVGSVRLVMTIHDALEFYVADEVSTQQVIDLLNPAVSYRAPQMPNAPEIRADWHEGRSWGSVVEVKTNEARKITGWQIEDDDRVWASFEEVSAYLAANELTVERTGVAHGLGDAVYNGLSIDGFHQAGVGPNEQRTKILRNGIPERAPEVTAEQVEQEFSALTTGPIDLAEPVVTVHITLAEMPTSDQWARFVAWRSEHPGGNSVLIHTPVGDVPLEETYALNHRHAGNIALIFPGATVSVDDPTMAL